ncbi:hypothetical protein VVR12_01865 [Rothia sp. LK2588]|uniref:hypothetical protein n=1 Tax=Rothia sp. LK2588 TaxID=3114369 RepID=UPI0034CFF402
MKRSFRYTPAWWVRLPVPRKATAMMIIAYLYLITQGVSNYIWPGLDTEGFHEIARAILSGILVFAGLAGALACTKGWWVVERPAIVMLGTVYVLHAYWAVADLDHNGDVPVQTVLRMCIIGTLLAKRYFQIEHYQLDPGR